MKIVVLDGYTLNPGDISWSGFEALGDFTCHDRTPADRIVEHIGSAEAAITNKTPLTRETLGACPNLKYIGVLATGYNIVDIAAAKEKGIVVTNIPTYGTPAVAQYVFALLLEMCHHVGHHAETVRQGRWSKSADFCYWDYPLVELYGKTMGVIGFGRIGRAVAAIAVAMGMKVLAHDEYRDPSAVVSVEPISPDNPLLYAENCIIMPHIAWAPREARERLMGIAADNLVAFIGGSPRNTVN